jgi:hypothetical protein
VPWGIGLQSICIEVIESKTPFALSLSKGDMVRQAHHERCEGSLQLPSKRLLQEGFFQFIEAGDFALVEGF